MRDPYHLFQNAPELVRSLGVSENWAKYIEPALRRWWLRNLKPEEILLHPIEVRESIVEFQSPLNTEQHLIHELLNAMSVSMSRQVGRFECGDVLAAVSLAVNFCWFGEMDEAIGRIELSTLCPTAVDDAIPESDLGPALWIALATFADFKPIQIECDTTGTLIVDVAEVGQVVICPDSTRAQRNFNIERLWELGQAGRYRAYFGSRMVVEKSSSSVFLDYPLIILGDKQNWECFLERHRPLLPENPWRRGWLEEMGII